MGKPPAQQEVFPFVATAHCRAPAPHAQPGHSSSMMSMIRITKRSCFISSPSSLSFDSSIHARREKAVVSCRQPENARKISPVRIEPAPGDFYAFRETRCTVKKQGHPSGWPCVILCLIVLICAELRQRQVGVFLLRPADAPLIVEDEQVVSPEVLAPTSCPRRG